MTAGKSLDNVADTVGIDSVPQRVYAADSRESGRLIDSVFRHILGEAPRMGWSTPDRFLAAERHRKIHIWSAAADHIAVATYSGALSSAEHAELAKTTHLACDTKGPLGQYTLTPAESLVRDRAFYTSVEPPSNTRVGLVGRRLTDSERAALHTSLAVTDSVRYIDTAFAAPSGAFFSVDAAYDRDGNLIKSALVLHDSSGAVIGSQIRGADAFECDGCGEPTIGEGFRRLYDVYNAFIVPGFPYPLLLLDTSTVEGRALSLLTFITKGTDADEYRIYEYVVECILGDPQEIVFGLTSA